MTFYNFRNFLKFFYYRRKKFNIGQSDANVRTCLKSNFVSVDYKLRSFYDSGVLKFLNSLVNSRPGNITFSCNFQKRNTCILRNKL